jgi:hypothetical protein
VYGREIPVEAGVLLDNALESQENIKSSYFGNPLKRCGDRLNEYNAAAVVAEVCIYKKRFATCDKPLFMCG